MSHDRRQAEDGIALIYVIFVTMILSGLATVFVARAVFEARATGNNANREAAVHVAEAGAEFLLGLINDEGEDFADKVITEGPTPTDTTVADHVYDPPTGLTGDALQAWEESWAIGLAEADWALGLDTTSGYTTQVIETDEGQAFGIRPKFPSVDEAVDAVFGVGFVPSIDSDVRQVRVVKMLIARRFFSPDHALLTGGSLDLGGNAAILSPECDEADPTAVDCNADVHANGPVDVTGTAHVIQGSLSSTDTITGSPVLVGGEAAPNEEQVTVPEISARDFYNRPEVTYNVDPGGQTVQWHDLCPDGTVRAGAATPCTGAVEWNANSTNPNDPSTFLGWKWNRPQGATPVGGWSGTAIQAGIFYVYKASADVTGTATASVTLQCENSECYYSATTQRAVSIFVEEDPAFPDYTGSLSIQGNPSMVAAFPDTLFITDNDLKMRGTSSGGNSTCFPDSCTDLQRYSGLIFVGEQAEIAGTVSLTGALIVSDLEDDCDDVTETSVTGTMTLDYDEHLKVDLSGRVTIEFWNEL